jgi:hypothetical protein
MTVKPKVAALNCPNCGAPLVIRGFAHTLTVVCANCLSVLDAKDPNFAILQKAETRRRVEPRIPLGTRGTWRGAPYEVIGFQVRTITDDGVEYSWSEYLLFNPYRGFRYLTEYQGHWNDVTTLRMIPEIAHGRRPTARVLGETYRHFQSASAETTFVLGEFPWQVRVGERVNTADFVAPPRMLSSEATDNEVVWSLGEYVSGQALWTAFKLPGRPPVPAGVYANQPSPYKGTSAGIWRLCLLLLILLMAVGLATAVLSRREQVFEQAYSFAPNTTQEASFVTPEFELKGRPANVEVAIKTDLENNWAYLSFALINSDTGQAFDFARELSYYAGTDSDGAWSEGDRNDEVLIPSVPAGRYYLRVEPEMDPAAAGVRYEIALRRDVPALSFIWLAAGLLLVPPVIRTFRSLAFEQKRWSESDYSSGGGS